MMDTVERFLSKVNKTNDCWLWTASTIKGYGQFWLDGTNQIASRVSWKLFIGPIPKGKCVLHHCDTPLCVRPDHLFLGTIADNWDDMMKKGRYEIRGIKHPKAKLDPDKVKDIRSSTQAGETQDSIARRLGVGQAAISMVVRGITWKEV